MIPGPDPDVLHNGVPCVMRDPSLAGRLAQEMAKLQDVGISSRVYRAQEVEALVLRLLQEAQPTWQSKVERTNLDGSLTLRYLQYINTTRAQRWHKGGLSDWSPLEWAGAMAGEVGEACNAAKKLKRIDDEIANINHEPGRSLTNRESACAAVAEEVADAIIYGVLLAERVGIDIEEAVRLKFNKKSEEYGFPERILPAPPLGGTDGR